MLIRRGGVEVVLAKPQVKTAAAAPASNSVMPAEARTVLQPELVSSEIRPATDHAVLRDAVGQPTSQAGPQTASQTPQAMTAPASPLPQQSAASSAAVQQLQPIDVPVRDQSWGDQLGDRVLMAAAGKTQTAEIRLSPAEMGPVRIQVSVDDGNASLSFQVHHAVTRDAIEQALPRLRELLADSGITLSQTSVGEQGSQQGNRDTGPAGGARAASDTELQTETEQQAEQAQPLYVADTLVDTFA